MIAEGRTGFVHIRGLRYMRCPGEEAWKYSGKETSMTTNGFNAQRPVDVDPIGPAKL